MMQRSGEEVRRSLVSGMTPTLLYAVMSSPHASICFSRVSAVGCVLYTCAYTIPQHQSMFCDDGKFWLALLDRIWCTLVGSHVKNGGKLYCHGHSNAAAIVGPPSLCAKRG